jgi:predicted transcriptional regulator
MSNETTRSTIELAAEVVAAFVSNNSVPLADLPHLIVNVHTAFQNAGHPVPQQEEPKPTPAVSVRKSITPDFIISLEDGKPYKSMKRHLARLGLTPDAYREKYSLPRDYPMVAPNYAARRSEMAKNMGLGQQRSRAAQAKAAHDDAVKSVPAEAPVTGAVTTSPAKAPAKRARKKAT